MARLPRLYAPGVPQLVQVRFARPLAVAHEATPGAALDLLQSWLFSEIDRQKIAVHAWVLLLDRMVLLGTPAQSRDISRIIQGLGRRIATSMTHGRAFEGRYRSALVDDAWTPACMIWLESLPVTHGLVDAAVRWPWSSAQEHVGLRAAAGMLGDHASYWEMGNTPFARQARHLALLQAGPRVVDSLRIEQAVFGQWALGEDDFTSRLSSRSSRRALPAPRGRPRKLPRTDTVTN